jgi:hypothetical protein
MEIDDSISRSIAMLKYEFLCYHNSSRNLLKEIIPISYSNSLPICNDSLGLLHKFAEINPIYLKSYDESISGVTCRIYEGDINEYWLSSKKYDTSYQPFYPTWMLSAYALALQAKLLGFEHVVDIGAGDGRLAYCASLLGMESFGIEIDEDLVQVQRAISSNAGVRFKAIRADATSFDYSTLDLTRPIFFISGLPEIGEMLANSVIKHVLSIPKFGNNAGFNFMGTHVMKSFSRDRTGWGWGSIIASFGLKLIGTITLPTLWTTDELVDTAYVYTRA